MTVAAGLVLVSIEGDAQQACPSGAPTAEVISAEGSVTVTRAGLADFMPTGGAPLCPGDRIVTGDASAIDIRFPAKNSITNVLSSSTVIIPAQEEADVTLTGGLMRFISSVSGSFRIRTPFTDAGIDGTEAMVAVDGPQADTLVLVREGIVTVTERRTSARIALNAGDASYAAATTNLVLATPENVPAKFRGYLLNPEGAADWAVYYPPILLGTGDASLERAAALLDAGQPDEAEALLAAYAGPDTAGALALRSLVAVFRNRTEDGAALADQAVAANPASASALIAQSYARQAAGDVDAALVSARSAVAAGTEDSYAWARLAEMELTVGNRSAALSAAERSLALGETALGHAVLGFARLATGETGTAVTAFDAAIALDAEAPLPRLGLGLARIKSGEADAGRLELETAASLDPQRAQLRGWLGRAYLEAGMGKKAAAQFMLAQEQDPDDPSPWLFEAQRLFQANRPVVAMGALDEAKARGAGRATVRGRDGLGEDQAVRDTATGRIFDVLGFDILATQAGAKAVTSDLSNPGAHRFLADVLRARPGFEIAVSSALLVAQLLSPPSKSPVQPRLGEPDLALLNPPGAARVSFSEFAPLFDGDGIYVIGSAGVGTQAVLEDEFSLSILEGNVSLAVGQFHSQTEGFRPNDDVRHNVIAIEGKIAATPWLTLTTELRVRKTVQGDRFLKAFSTPTTIFTETTEERIQLTLGAHAELSATNDLLIMGVIAETDQFASSLFVDPVFLVPLTGTDDNTTQSFNFEVQDIQRFSWGSVRAGAAYAVANQVGEFGPGFIQPFGADVEQISGYIYADARPLDGVEITLGVSVDHAERTDSFPGFDAFFNSVTLEVERDFTQVNPKAGIRLEPLDGVVLRGAYARTLKRQLVQDRTLEPTTIAGFAQFFDDPEQTDAHMFAGGVDIQILDNLWIGGEYIHRQLDVPGFGLNNVTFNQDVPVLLEGEEKIARAYINATFGENWAGSIGVEYSENESQIPDRPDVVETLLVPVAVKYFDPSGFFGGVEAIFFDQSSIGQVDAGIDGLLNIDTDEQGVVLNAAVGYRLPNGRGVASLEVNNILDSSFALQNSLNNSARPSTRPLAEGLSVMGRFTIGF